MKKDCGISELAGANAEIERADGRVAAEIQRAGKALILLAPDKGFEVESPVFEQVRADIRILQCAAHIDREIQDFFGPSQTFKYICRKKRVLVRGD